MSIDRGAIDEQLRSIGEGERWWEQREFRDLPHILHSEERIRGLVNGKVLGGRLHRLLPSPLWLIVVTDARLICLKQQRFGRKEIDVPREHIVGMNHRSGLLAAQITLQTAQRRYRIRIPKAEAFRFAGALSALLPRPIPASAAGGFGGGLLSAGGGFPSPDLVTRADLEDVESSVDRLEAEVERLRQQVDFLEKLMQQRAGGALPATIRPAAGETADAAHSLTAGSQA